jgi:hypothetical protein
MRHLERLGKQLYEYVLVWAAAKKTGREPYIPSCVIREFEKIFRNLPVSPLSYILYWPVEEHPVPVTVDKLDHSNDSIILGNYI